MKKLVLFGLAVAAMAGFTGCGSDEAPFGDNELVIDGASVPLVPGYYYDSPTDLTLGLDRREDGNTVTHYRRYVYLKDQTVEADAYVYISFYSKGSDGFRTGSFNVLSSSDEVNEESPSFVTIEADFYNTDVYPLYYFEGEGGKITVRESGDDMVITFNINGTAEVPLTISRQDAGPSESVEVKVRGQYKGVIPYD